ncbi:MAG TPA: creatininase family protein [Gaiellaceae bacterium]|nr:creatininase family protein [Gaiellaceae bacterium]
MTFVEHASLTWPEAERLEAAFGVICVAALEQHGPALPLATDALIGEILAVRVAESFDAPVVVMPVPYGGLSDHHLAFPGTVSFDAQTLRGIVDAYVAALKRMGVNDVFLFTSHGGNFAFLTEAAAAYAGRDDVRLAVYDDRDTYFAATFAGARRAGFVPPETDWHAGGLETSQGLAEFPQLVRPFDDVVGYTAADPGWLDRVLVDGLHSVSPSGVLGSPAGANATAGAAIFDALAEILVARVEEAFGLTRSV